MGFWSSLRFIMGQIYRLNLFSSPSFYCRCQKAWVLRIVCLLSLTFLISSRFIIQIACFCSLMTRLTIFAPSEETLPSFCSLPWFSPFPYFYDTFHLLCINLVHKRFETFHIGVSHVIGLQFSLVVGLSQPKNPSGSYAWYHLNT